MMLAEIWVSIPGLWFAMSLLAPVARAADSSCAAYPVAIAIHNVTLSTGNLRRGANVSVGSNQQPMALVVQTTSNNTNLWGESGYCSGGWNYVSDWSDTMCTTLRGGAYSQTSSSSYSVAATDSYPADSDASHFNYASDTLVLNENVTVDNFPMGVFAEDPGNQGYWPQAYLGLGANSSLLTALNDSGMIASRSWGYYAGSYGQADTSIWQDGQIVLGGYDRAKTSGTPFVSKLNYSNSDCSTGLLIHISDISVKSATGTQTSIFDSDETGFDACLTPGLPNLLSLHFDPYFEDWMNKSGLSSSDYYDVADTRTFGLDYYNIKYPDDVSPYTGELVLTVNDGPTATYLNNAYVVPEATIDSSTGAITGNSSAHVLRFNSQQDTLANALPGLGDYAFSYFYLYVNYDVGEFRLWTATRTAATDLVAVDSSNTTYSAFCAATSTTVSGGGNTTETSTATATAVPATESSSSSLSGGAIAGIAVSAVAGVALLGALAFFLLRRRKSQHEPVPGRPDVAEASEQGGPGTTSYVSSPGTSTAVPSYVSPYQSGRYYVQELDTAATAKPGDKPVAGNLVEADAGVTQYHHELE